MATSREFPASEAPDAPRIDGVTGSDFGVAERVASRGARRRAGVDEADRPAAARRVGRAGAAGRTVSIGGPGARAAAKAVVPVCRPDGPRAG
jgi:hypothetical protein